MRAAVVTSFDRPPTVAEIETPSSADADAMVLDVVAAGLHPRVRSQADGSHYTSTDELPLVPGIDGVGRDADGVLRYFVLPDTRWGSLAERVLVDVRRSVPLPDGADPVLIAAAMNPAMSSWVALRQRVGFTGGRVVVLGATGNAGRMALEVARRLGASYVAGVGRDLDRLAAVSADRTVVFSDRDGLAEVGAAADVVLDYVWGEPTAAALRAIVPARADDDRLLSWIQIGSMAGTESPIPSAALRATNLRLIGSGQGSVATRAIVAELAELAEVVPSLHVAARAVPLADVTDAWTAPATDERVVIVP